MFGCSENRRMKNDIIHCLVERGRGRKKWWGPQVFSPLSKYNLSKLEWKVKKIFVQNYAPSFNVFFFSFVTLFFVFCFFSYLFFLSLGSSSFPSFFFFLNFYFYYFFKEKTFGWFLMLFFEMSNFIYTQEIWW